MPSAFFFPFKSSGSCIFDSLVVVSATGAPVLYLMEEGEEERRGEDEEEEDADLSQSHVACRHAFASHKHKHKLHWVLTHTHSPCCFEDVLINETCKEARLMLLSSSFTCNLVSLSPSNFHCIHAPEYRKMLWPSLSLSLSLSSPLLSKLITMRYIMHALHPYGYSSLTQSHTHVPLLRIPRAFECIA